MPRYPKKATFKYHIWSTKEQKWVDFESIPKEKQEEIKIKNYQNFLRALGAVPVSPEREAELRRQEAEEAARKERMKCADETDS